MCTSLENKDIYRIRTHHKTEMFLDENFNIRHRSAENVPAEYLPIYASPKDAGVLLFFVKDNRIEYIQDFVDSQNYFFGEKPVVIEIVENADGSIALKQGNKFWSARREADHFDLRPRALAWEHLFLYKADCTLDSLIASDAQPIVQSVIPVAQPLASDNQTKMDLADREVYRIRTHHRTEVYVDRALIVRHVNIEDVPVDYRPLYAVLEDTGVVLFFIDNDRPRYVSSIRNDGFDFGNNPSVIELIKNENDSISFKQGNRFLSARQQSGQFDLRPKILAWEQYRLIKTEFSLSAVDENAPKKSTLVMTHDRCKISIIIPSSEGVSIAPALNSITRQTFSDYEVVIADKSSAEGISIDDAIQEALGDKLSVIQAGANANTLGSLYNVGINFAGGSYVLLMGGTDELEPTALEQMYELAVRTDAEAVFFTRADSLIKVTFDLADRVRMFVKGGLGMSARGWLLKREFLVSNRIEFPRLKAADEMVYSFCIAFLAKNYVIASDKSWKFGSELENDSKDLSFFMVTNEAFEVLDNFMKEQEFFNQSPEYKYVVLDCINEHCKKYLKRGNMTPYEFYEAVLKEVQANRVAFNKTAFLAYNFCTANWQYAQILKKDREIRALNEEIKKVKEARAQKEK